MSVSIAFSRSSLDITAPDPAKSLTSSFVPMIVTDSTTMSSSALTLTINDVTKRTPIKNIGAASSKILFKSLFIINSFFN
ncbi:MAG: hypothetical protein ACJ0FM_03130 [Gammaproteobacteria bacterium]|jgi:hypothetical protein|tara:strand:+ start:2726 stop:2965 length:240 start_codon:yes stop_codon:yes gene_type:complete